MADFFTMFLAVFIATFMAQVSGWVFKKEFEPRLDKYYYRVKDKVMEGAKSTLQYDYNVKRDDENGNEPRTKF